MSEVEMFDVVAVSIRGSRVLWTDGPLSKAEADATIRMAVARQGEGAYFTTAEPGKFKEGDEYTP